MKKKSTIFISLIMASILFFPSAVGSQEREHEPMVAPINQEVSSHDVSVILKYVFLYPDERSLYPPGQQNFGMPVELEYGKGPVVIVEIRREPAMIDRLTSVVKPDWIHVQVYSDGKPLSPRSSSGAITGFSFWAEQADGNVIELDRLGNVKCQIRLSTIVKVGEMSVQDVARGMRPIIEDADVNVWDVKWDERATSYSTEPETSIRLGIERKSKWAAFDVVFKRRGSGEGIHPTSSSGGENDISFSRNLYKNELSSAELWKIVPVVEKTYPVRFIPQKDYFRE